MLCIASSLPLRVWLCALVSFLLPRSRGFFTAQLQQLPRRVLPKTIKSSHAQHLENGNVKPMVWHQPRILTPTSESMPRAARDVGMSVSSSDLAGT
ncbi:hypothetical protein Trisim1_005904 [Trichoderma cf. simile WF8]